MKKQRKESRLKKFVVYSLVSFAMVFFVFSIFLVGLNLAQDNENLATATSEYELQQQIQREKEELCATQYREAYNDAEKSWFPAYYAEIAEDEYLECMYYATR